MITINVSMTDGVSPALRKVIQGLTGDEASALNERGGRAAVLAASQYHREFDQSGGWRGARYLGPSQNEGSDFGSAVAAGWNFQSSERDGATISNNATHYAFKVRGGTIAPKRAKALTIPLIREARGLYASVYEQNTGRKLFISKSRNALLERVEGTTTGARGRRRTAGSSAIRTNQVRAVYALVKSVTQPPWPGAVPPDEVFTTAFVTEYREGLAELIEES